MKIPSLVALTCQEVTELVSEYMADAMTAEDHARFEQHLHACTWCMTYLTQMRATVHWAGKLASPAEPSEHARLVEVFRRWKREQQ